MQKYKATHQSNKDINTRRPLANICVKLYRDTKSQPCDEFQFDLTVSNYHVLHHLDELLQIADVDDKTFYEHHGNQPLLFPTMRYDDDHHTHWNGLLHISTDDVDAARKFVREQDEFHIVMAYYDPYTDKYHIVITTGAEDTSDESFRATRKKYIPLLHEYIKVFKMHYYNFYVRALPLDHYKVLDRDILFGEPEPVFSDEYTSENGNHYCLPHHQQEIPTVGKTIRSLFGHFFTKRKPFNIPR